jgi:pyruvate/2-oxoglutarate/acetoin dehydrogenase E1 component
MGRYYEALCRAMKKLGEDERTIFLGQAVGCDGTGMSASFRGLPPDRVVEFPVAEDMQMGFATGLSLTGWLPVCVYPRWNFLGMAFSQLVLHLDKLPLYSTYNPRVLVRVAVGNSDPLNPGPQHLGDFSAEFDDMLLSVSVRTLTRAEDIEVAYDMAALHNGSTILVEYPKLY